MEICKVKVFEEPETVKTIAQIYQAAFGGSPWYEGQICPICRYTVGLDLPMKFCEKCYSKDNRKILMVEFWPEAKVISDLYQENSNEGSICLGALWRYQIVGFAWGYQIETDLETLEKIDAPNLLNVIPFGVYFYLDECAVLPQFQGLGAGKKLVEYIVKKQPHDKIILRTLKDSPMHHLIQKRGGKELLLISENRLIMSLSKSAYNIPWDTYFSHY